MSDELVPDSVIPHGSLAPLRWRDLPPPVPLPSMIGPSVILAGLALGSGEFVLWPFITYKVGFVLFWACMLSVVTQYFLNMEITRWTLATGESVITGFCRLSKHWAGVFLVFNVVPWMIPAWSEGAAQMTSWLVFGPTINESGQVLTPYVRELSIAGLLLCGAILTLGPVIYETIEKIQMFLVAGILVTVVIVGCFLIRGDAVVAMGEGLLQFGTIPNHPDLKRAMLLGAIAFAGAGGTMNLGQSNYVKEKGYGMGHYIGRITSPITGKEEPITEIGYHFRPTPDNLSRWQRWWFNAGFEHFLSFLMTCTICLVLMTLICYSAFYDEHGQLVGGADQFRNA
ncbi:MAG: Nramp family divalent metal transporter, partial [Planctomycetaceae bacterium]|nr:Nramp family divalent metal transporter [Planctomycetaceae bacterium]